MLRPSPTPLSRMSHSDYCSLSSSDDDADMIPKFPSQLSNTEPGICPHCKKTYKETSAVLSDLLKKLMSAALELAFVEIVLVSLSQYVSPVTLQCGHSLCSRCCTALLESSGCNTIPRRSRIRMGLSSVSYSQLERKSSFQSMTSVHSFGVVYKSPQCIVCGERPKTTPPVPNLELATFLRTLNAEKMTEHENPAYRENSNDDSLSYDDESCKRIRECKIGVMGASGVGKTSLTRVQYGNDILFSDLLGKRTEANLSNTFMIDILDANVSAPHHVISTKHSFAGHFFLI
ncbi:unnamed protein product [Nippostrongylus brasiliensis]|uniref:RING-type domain-containing protein n=1 Tax=Nippostrongylus brasiliensis TaxID=27835 RepID=A0A0N4YWP3_NIPBR|nr:unnamed protein product [Nippostrongylus brasiliensis]